MALVRSTLEAAIKNMLNELKQEDDQQTSIAHFSSQLASAIDTYIKTATVNTVVTTSAGAGTGTGNLS